MALSDAYRILVDRLKVASGLLELPSDTSLLRDLRTVCEQLERSTVRIAVFGPFNYGKSTLLNALLGERTLPIDLIPTTGAAITVRYGTETATTIRFTNGQSMTEAGTEVLKRFAILDDDRRMREDVAAVEVTCPHPFLKPGVELVDLPGTDDREAQDALVKDQLLTADLIVQVLDGRKLMTLGEREHLRDWLLDRGIETVVFVVNFLNLLEPEEQKQVYNRLRFVAESFRAKLPAGVSNLYRVDALPALRARLKGNLAEAEMAGLPTFESALHTIVQAQQDYQTARLPRVLTIARQIQQGLRGQVDQLVTDLSALDDKQHQKHAIKQKAYQLISSGFAESVNRFTEWLSLAYLLEAYQEELAQALYQGTFKTWESGPFKKMAIDHQQAIAKWVHQACEFFGHDRPHQLLISFPPEPTVELPPPSMRQSIASRLNQIDETTLVAGGLGWLLGGPVGGAILGSASYLLNKTRETDGPDSESAAVAQGLYNAYEAAREYLVNFSALNLATLQRYELAADRVIQYSPTPVTTQKIAQHYQLDLLQATLTGLDEALTNIF